jgi:hypothetical protein
MRRALVALLLFFYAAPAAAAGPDALGVGVRVDDALAHTFARATSPEAAPLGATLYVPARLGGLVLEPELAVLTRAADATATFPDGSTETSSSSSTSLTGRLGVFWRLERDGSAIWLGGRVGARRVHASTRVDLALGAGADSTSLSTTRVDALAGLAVGGELLVTPAISLALEARLEGELFGDADVRREPADPDAPEVSSGGASLTPTLAVIARFYLL